MPSASVQDYAKAIYALEERSGVASTTALAGRLEVSAPAVSAMVKKLAVEGLAEHVRYRGVNPRTAARDLVGQVLPGEAATLRAAQEALDGERHGLRALWPFLGPAFIASVAYLDPGNFATDVAGGAKYGYLLLWAVLASNL